MPPKLRPSGETPPVPSGLGRIGTLVAIGSCSYMAAISGSIVIAILPILTETFATDVATLEWVVTLYLLVQSGLLISFGRLADLRGVRLVFIGGLVLFIIASGLCGLAPSPGFLIGARAFQAIGGAMLFATSTAVLTRVFPPSQRGRAMGFQATMVYLGLASGPPLGGVVVDSLGWRSVFAMNIVIGLVALAFSLRFIPRNLPSYPGEKFDWPGAVTYLVGLVGVLVALNQGHAWGWTSPAVVGCLVVGLIMLGVFAAVELRVESPMLDLGLFRQRSFSAPVLSAVLNYIGVNSTFFLVPFYLIQGRGMSAGQAGLILTAQPLIMAVTASFSGAFSDRIGSRLPATLGMTLLSAGLFLLSRATETTPLFLVTGALAIIGLGIGLFTSPNSSAVMGAVPSERRGVASGILSTARTLGNVLGIALASAIFKTVLSGGGLGGADPTVINGVSAGLTVASIITLLGAITSATRPERDVPS